MADYQQALDVQQTRAIQYQQALQALERARALCQLPELTADNAEDWLETFQAKEQEATEALLQLEQKLSVADAAHSQFEQAYQLVVSIAGQVSRSEAWQTARELLRDWPSQQHLAERVQPLRMRLSELEQRLRAQQDAERLLQEFCKRQGKPINRKSWKSCNVSWNQRLKSFLSVSVMPVSGAWKCVRNSSKLSSKFRN